MSHELPTEDEDLLRRLALGEVDGDDPTLRSRAEASPALAAAIDELQLVGEHLAATAEADRELVRASVDSATEEDRDLVLAALEEARGASGASESRPPPWGRWALVAAALVAALFIWRGVPDGGRLTGLLGSELCVSPKGAVEAFAPFVVDYDLEPWWTVEIVVTSDSGEELLRSPRLDQPRWDPDSDQLGRLEDVDEIRWSFVVLDAGQESVASGGCRAWRSP